MSGIAKVANGMDEANEFFLVCVYSLSRFVKPRVFIP
ncbi:hypothetical protein SAMN05216428_10214 [Nitrosospira sp. Nsp11]|nr:hypothetical protein SAMN05216315_13614 [Nitrosospira sp. Nsp18]SHL31825.1 hypothetical protein SAMN05216428_10214 [Nitrosospira sp. Nsp11]